MSTQARHPGGSEMTEYLLDLAGNHRPAGGRAVDLGAGSGDTVRLLRRCGYEAEGIDLDEAEDVRKGDMLDLPYDDHSFDLVISECAMFQSGDQMQALKEAVRILKDDGLLLIADLFPLKRSELPDILEQTGLQILFLKDHTSFWKDYIIEKLWSDEYISEVCRLADQKCRYYLIGLKGLHHE